MSNYKTKRNLIKRWPSEPEAIENEALNGLRLWMLQGCPLEGELYNALDQYYKDAFKGDPVSGKIILQNHPDKLVKDTGETHLSHDQVKAAICFSVLAKKNYHKIMWSDTKLMHYHGTRLRISDWVFLGLANKNAICWILSWFIMSFFMITSFGISKDVRFKDPSKKYSKAQLDHMKIRGEKHILVKIFTKDSGPALWWTQVETMRIADFTQARFFSWMLKKLSKISFGSPIGVIKWYYQFDNNHPIVRLANER